MLTLLRRPTLRPTVLRKRWTCRPARRRAVLARLAHSSSHTLQLQRRPTKGALAPVDVLTGNGLMLVARTDLALLGDLYTAGLIEWPGNGDDDFIWLTLQGVIQAGDGRAH